MLRAFRIAAVSLLFVTAFLSFGGAASAAGERFVLVSHAPDSDVWWNTIKTAVREAGEHLGVSVEYRNPPRGRLKTMARLIEEAAAERPDGIVTTIADYDVLDEPIRRAVEAGIPVVTINSGTAEQSASLGAMMHVGQPERDAGIRAGERLRGVDSFLCVNHYISNPASVERCKGFARGLGIDFEPRYMIDSGQEPETVAARVRAHLKANPGVEAVLALGPLSAHPTLKVLRALNAGDRPHMVTFDLSPTITQGIRDGVIDFAIDQQPYLQAYIPVWVLTLRARYGLDPGNNINSGPGFVTRENVDLVERLIAEYQSPEGRSGE
ncbi:sugar ABC transporter substrate-binding protein [Arhodomonas sp. AD133]|uniref:sugar ABC transporter substrate-binding protein n=1 Tax=Arhodomonas sp. AD133 TaxID=3415009 RepID=UPI003EBF8A3F